MATQSAAGAHNGQWIVFSAAPNGLYPNQLFRVQTNGTGLQQLTKGKYSATDAAFSPDGKRVVFARLGSGIFVMNLDGSGQRRLTRGTHDLFPVWSPNGKTIAFARLFKNNYRLFTMSPAGRNLHRIAKAPPTGRPSWTADSKSLFLPSGSLEKVNAATGAEERHIQYTLDVPQATTVSPDSKQVAFYGPAPSVPGCGEVSCVVFSVYLAKVPGKSVRTFVKDGSPAGWSPDGKRLAIVYRGKIALFSVTTKARTLITTGPNTPAADAPPAWQPVK